MIENRSSDPRQKLTAITLTAFVAGCGESQQLVGTPSLTAPSYTARSYATGTCFNAGATAFVSTVPCGGNVPAISHRFNATPAYKASHSLLFVTNYIYDSQVGGDVAIYDAKHGSRIAIITNGIDEPGFDCVDASGTLYVPQSGSIVEYALGQTVPLRYITHGSGTPADCAIDAKGNLWVAAISDVIEYRKGSTEPYKIISDGVSYANSVAFDHRGNMYVGNNVGIESAQSFIAVYRPGERTPSRTITNGIFYPEGLAIDSDDDLYVANFGYAKGEGCGDVAEYRAGRGKPFRKLTDEISGPVGLTFANSRLYEDNGGNAACDSNSHIPFILEFPLGATKPSKKMISILRSPGGLTYYPPGLP